MPASESRTMTRGLMAPICCLSSSLRSGGTWPPSETRSMWVTSNRPVISLKKSDASIRGVGCHVSSSVFGLGWGQIAAEAG
jgi:hypothetical protein